MENLQFTPSRVEGLPNVKSVIVKPDRIALLSEGQWIEMSFDTMAEWPKPKWLWKLKEKFGKRPAWLPVGERDWFHPPADRFFRFFTQPPLVIYMPTDETEEFGASHFLAIQAVMAKGGYATWDLG